MKNQFGTKLAALAATSALALGAIVGIADGDASAQERRQVERTTHTVVIAQEFALASGGGGGGGGGGIVGATDKIAIPGGHAESDKYCGNDLVDDDIVECDIGEIAYVCPDGKTPSSQECENAMGSEFP